MTREQHDAVLALTRAFENSGYATVNIQLNRRPDGGYKVKAEVVDYFDAGGAK
jgi:hypothetical protein